MNVNLMIIIPFLVPYLEGNDWSSVYNIFLPPSGPHEVFTRLVLWLNETEVRPSLQDLVDVVNGSANVNFAQLVGTQEGDVLVPTYDWGSYLSPHFKLEFSQNTYPTQCRCSFCLF